MYGWDRAYFETFVVVCKLQNLRCHRCGPCAPARVMPSRGPTPPLYFWLCRSRSCHTHPAPTPHCSHVRGAPGCWPSRSTVFRSWPRPQPSGLCSRIWM